MKNVSNHIIQKVFLEVETKSEEKAMQIKNNAGLFLQEELFPVLEALFSKYNAEDHIIRIDKLGVDLSISDWGNRDEMKTEFVKKVEKKLEPFIHSDLSAEWNLKEKKSAQDLETIRGIKTEQNYRDTFLFFLENGYLPWYGKQEYVAQVVETDSWQTHLENQFFVDAIKTILLKNSLAAERMILQFSNETILKFINVFENIELKNYSGLLAFINKTTADERFLFLKHLLKNSLQQSENDSIELAEKLRWFEELIAVRFGTSMLPVTNEQVQQYLLGKGVEFEKYFEQKTYTKLFALTLENRKKLIANGKNIVSGAQLGRGQKELERTNFEKKSTIISKKFANSVTEKEPTFFAAGTSQLLVQNAGMVLFHPFLKALFNHFDWILENGKIRENDRFKAVQTLHYCATGSEDFFEDKLILEKYLCGQSLQTPIPRNSLLNTEIKEEANNMLKAVVENWLALKNTSPHGLRQMFVQRNGKLVQIEKGFRLIVERKAQDILMDKLPWNISIVKLPWKDDLLFVEW